MVIVDSWNERRLRKQITGQIKHKSKFSLDSWNEKRLRKQITGQVKHKSRFSLDSWNEKKLRKQITGQIKYKNRFNLDSWKEKRLRKQITARRHKSRSSLKKLKKALLIAVVLVALYFLDANYFAGYTAS